MSSMLVGIPLLAAAPKTTPAAGEAALFLKRLLPRFLMMLCPPADRVPSLSTTGRSVAGDLIGVIGTTGCATSVACADATIDLRGEDTQRPSERPAVRSMKQCLCWTAYNHAPWQSEVYSSQPHAHTTEAGSPLTAMRA